MNTTKTMPYKLPRAVVSLSQSVLKWVARSYYFKTWFVITAWEAIETRVRADQAMLIFLSTHKMLRVCDI